MPATYDHLKLIIQRFDTHINSANTKGAFLLAFNTFLCGAILSNQNALSNLVSISTQPKLKIGILLFFILGIVCLIIVLLAIYPFLHSGNSSRDSYHSHIYFGSIAEFDSPGKYAESISKQKESESYHDLSIQIFYIAIALKRKYKYLEYATKIILLQLAVLSIMGSFIILDNL